MEGTVSQDAGAQIRDGVKSVATLGAPPETDWPYNINKFAQKPPKQAYTDAKSDLATTYARVTQDLTQMRGCLAEGYPFVFGFTVYESFESQAVAKDWRRANAENGRSSRRWSRGCRNRVQRRPESLHCPKFLGQRMGTQWLLSNAI
jgi:C1A family cysteine protease